MIAPASQAKRISAPVFMAWSRMMPASSGRRTASASRSSIWPPAMPPAPAARASASTSASPPLGRHRVASSARMSKASVSRRRRQGWRSPRRRPCARSAGRGADRRRPWPAGRHGSANSNARIRAPPPTRNAASPSARKQRGAFHDQEGTQALAAVRARRGASRPSGVPAARSRRKRRVVEQRSSSASSAAARATSACHRTPFDRLSSWPGPVADTQTLRKKPSAIMPGARSRRTGWAAWRNRSSITKPKGWTSAARPKGGNRIGLKRWVRRGIIVALGAGAGTGGADFLYCRPSCIRCRH